MDSRLPRSDQHNDEAARALWHIHYAFGETVVESTSAVGITLWARQLGQRNREFLAAQFSTTVLHLPCRPHTRVPRIAPPPSVRWHDVGFPEVRGLRRHLLREPEDVDYRTANSSVTADGWPQQILANRPTVAVFEGLTTYPHTEEDHWLVQGDTGHLPGGRLLFEVYGTIGIRFQKPVPTVRDAGAALHCGVDDQKELKSWTPALTLLDSVRSVDIPGLDHLPLSGGLGIRLLAHISVLRDVGRIMRYGFPSPDAPTRSGRRGAAGPDSPQRPGA